MQVGLGPATGRFAKIYMAEEGKNIMRKSHHIYSRIVLLILFLSAAILLAVHFWPTGNSREIMNACAAAGESRDTVAATTIAQTPPPLFLGLDAYRHLDKLSYLELGARVEAASPAHPHATHSI